MPWLLCSRQHLARNLGLFFLAFEGSNCFGKTLSALNMHSLPNSQIFGRVFGLALSVL